MNELAPAGLSGWDNFYVIVGSSGAALIGLQFVVITLITESRRRTTPATLGAFGTPTVVHLAGALVISAIMSAPWRSLLPLSIVLAVGGVAGLGYCALVIKQARTQTVYQPVWEDWLFHMILPTCAYTAITISAVFLHTDGHAVAFVIAAAALALLLIAIHNAWDTVTYIVVADTDSGEANDDPPDDAHVRSGVE